MNIADFLILNGQMPRSLAYCYEKIVSELGYLAKDYGERLPAHDTADAIRKTLQTRAIKDDHGSGPARVSRGFRHAQQPARHGNFRRLPVLCLGGSRHETEDQPRHRIPLRRTGSAFSLQRLRLTPPTVAGQTVLNWSLHVEGAKPEVEYDDQFGNHVNLVSLEGEQQDDAHRRRRRGRDRKIETGSLGPHTGFCPLWLFLRETPRTKPGKLVKELIKGVSGDNELARMHALMAAIHEAVAYQARHQRHRNHGGTGAGEEERRLPGPRPYLRRRARAALGVPARYVSGYLMMEEKVEQAATHAWAEAHVPGLGWVGFDPANKICPDERYVRVASGLCYRDAAPVSGMRIGTPGEKLTVIVKVEDQGQIAEPDAELEIDGIAGRVSPAAISSVTTLNCASRAGPNAVEIATSVASRPVAIRMRPMRGVLWRASTVYQWPPR